MQRYDHFPTFFFADLLIQIAFYRFVRSTRKMLANGESSKKQVKETFMQIVFTGSCILKLFTKLSILHQNKFQFLGRLDERRN